MKANKLKFQKLFLCIFPSMIFSASSSSQSVRDDFNGYDQTIIYDSTSGEYIGRIAEDSFIGLCLLTKGSTSRLNPNLQMDFEDRFITIAFKELEKIKVIKLLNEDKVIQSETELYYSQKFSDPFKFEFKSLKGAIIDDEEIQYKELDQEFRQEYTELLEFLGDNKESMKFFDYSQMEYHKLMIDKSGTTNETIRHSNEEQVHHETYAETKVLSLSGETVGTIRQDNRGQEKLFCQDGSSCIVGNDCMVAYKQDGKPRVANLVAGEMVISSICGRSEEPCLLGPFGAGFRFDTVTAVNIPLKYEELTYEQMRKISEFLKKAGFEEPSQYIDSSSASRGQIKYACEYGIEPKPDPIECKMN